MNRFLQRGASGGPPAAVHGGPDATGAARHDFSTNGNACGPCPQALDALARADAARYPDPAYTALRDRLADFHGVAPSRIHVAASASEFIFRITAAVARHGGRSVNLPTHAYGDYARAARAWGLTSVREGEAPSLVWRCDPSSPLGQPVAGLAGFVEALHEEATCVLDLAYEPLRLDGSLELATAQRDHVWQLWTPNKALGLTGVRAAYAIAPLDAGPLAETVEEMAASWPVGAHGVALLEAWSRRPAQEWLAASRETLREWRHRQRLLCEALGWRVQPSAANFFCVVLPGDAEPRLSAAWREHGVKLRDAASFGLDGQWRLSVLPPASQDALRAAVEGARESVAAGRAATSRVPLPAAAPASCCPPLS
jgi:histidinol-phosphate aminotransferase